MKNNRVWYVGVTRTKQNLYIMTAKQEDRGYDIESIGISKFRGTHYMYMEIQPAEFINKNKLLVAECNAIKYICRHSRKGGIEDIDKAIHNLDMRLKKGTMEPNNHRPFYMELFTCLLIFCYLAL